MFSQKKILVIDDEPFNCQVINSMLSILEFEDLSEKVDYCYSGKAALKMLESNIVRCSNLDTIKAKFKLRHPMQEVSLLD